MTISNQNHTINVKDETSSINYVEENVWELMESLQYNQSKYADTKTTFNITLLIFIIFLLGIVLSIGGFRWYTKNKVINMKI